MGLLFGVFYSQSIIRFVEVCVDKVLVTFICVNCEYDMISFRLKYFISYRCGLRHLNKLTRQCAHALVLYNALNLNAQMWHV